MAKGKLSTPDWIKEGFDSEADYNKAKGIDKQKKSGKTFKIRECPKCGSDGVAVVIGEVGMWECKKCRWKGVGVVEKELTENEFMKYLDEKGEEVA
jgi:ribosomal protein L37AE/L43A